MADVVGAVARVRDRRGRATGGDDARATTRASERDGGGDDAGRPSRGRQRASFSAHAATAGGVDGRLEDAYDDGRPVNPFKIVDDELRAIGERMRRRVASDIPALSTASEYFFKLGAEGKRMRPTVLMLMASAMTNGVMTSAAQGGWRETDHAPAHQAPADAEASATPAEIAEMIHVASLLHDDVLDNAATRRGLRALNLEVGNKLAILAGDFLLSPKRRVTLGAAEKHRGHRIVISRARTSRHR